MRSGHFGRCDCFTLVDIEQGKVKDVTVIPNPPHIQGQCLAPVGLLKLHGANAIIVGGIGMRPLTGFREAGMEVYLGTGPSVSDVVLEFIVDALTPMSPQEACGGH
jgi:predicted Fe-Mo cluster-binding NifX family protein